MRQARSAIPDPLWRQFIGLASAGMIAAFLLFPPPVRAGNADKGSDVYLSECSNCHSVVRGRNKKGPSLFGVVGRMSGTEPGYNYSAAMKQTHWVWTTDKLHWYLSQRAKTAIPGVKMKYDGLDDAQALDDLITYLGTLH